MMMRDGPKPRDRIRSSNLGPLPLPHRITKIPRHQHGEVQRGSSLVSMRDVAHHHRIPELTHQGHTHRVPHLGNARPVSSSLQSLNTHPGIQQSIPLPRPVEPPVQPGNAHGTPQPHNLPPAQRTHGGGPGPTLPPENHEARLRNPPKPQVLLQSGGPRPSELQRNLSFVHIGQASDISQHPVLGERPHEVDPSLPSVNHKAFIPRPIRLGPHPHRHLGDNPEQSFTPQHELLQIRPSSGSGRGTDNPLPNRSGHPQRLDHVLEPPIPGRRLPSGPSGSKPPNCRPLERLRHMPEREPVLPQQPLSRRPGQPGLQNGNPRHRVHRNQRPKPSKIQSHDGGLVPAQGLNPANDGSTAPERHHSNVMLDADLQNLDNLIGSRRLNHGVRHSERAMPPMPQQVQVGQPAGTPEPISRVHADRADRLQRGEGISRQRRVGSRKRHLLERLPQPNPLAQPGQRMRRQRLGLSGPSRPGHCYSVTHDVSTSHPRRAARRHP
ncbi:hypothetical protein LX90_008749 [Lentzea flava]|nr:hypothetical protein [Lentzea flava]